MWNFCLNSEIWRATLSDSAMEAASSRACTLGSEADLQDTDSGIDLVCIVCYRARITVHHTSTSKKEERRPRLHLSRPGFRVFQFITRIKDRKNQGILDFEGGNLRHQLVSALSLLSITLSGFA